MNGLLKYGLLYPMLLLWLVAVTAPLIWVAGNSLRSNVNIGNASGLPGQSCLVAPPVHCILPGR